MESGLVYVALVSIFVIGIIGGGAAVFFFRRMVINRQLRTAQRKAARTVAEARIEAKDVLVETKEEAEKLKATAEAEHRERPARGDLQTSLGRQKRSSSRRILLRQIGSFGLLVEGLNQTCLGGLSLTRFRVAILFVKQVFGLVGVILRQANDLAGFKVNVDIHKDRA